MTINRQEFLVRVQLEHETLEAWIEEEWLIPSGTAAEITFSDVDLARAKLIRELKYDLGINDAGVGVTLSLLDQVHGLRRMLAELLQTMRQRETRHSDQEIQGKAAADEGRD
jgi:chaperone modulatory protein CbpM